jgi:chromosome segregation ATPase
MPSKSRKKVSTQKAAPKPKKADKLDQILLRLDRIDEHLSEHDKRFDAHDKRFDAHDKRFDAHDKRFDAHDKRFDSLQNEFHGEIAKLREENREEHAHDRKMMLKLHDEQTRRIDKLQGDFDEFRDFVYTNLDVVRSEYDTSRQERVFAGAAQDRQQKEIDHLKQSDEKQNEVLGNLDHRVSQLELNKAA